MNSRKDNPKARRLSERDRQILEHVVRYRIGLMEPTHRQFFGEQDPSAVCKVVQRSAMKTGYDASR